MIPQSYIEEVVQRNDIVDVVQSYVQLRRRGRTCVGLCPFHSEKTPSFVVYPENQSFYCFGCGAGGSTITFMEKIENLGYVEAVKQLAARAGMPMPEEDDRQGRLRQRILDINKDAARYFFNRLNADNAAAANARAYWHRRGLADDTIRRFGLGYAPDDFRDLHNYLRQRGYTDEELLESGIVKRSEKGNVYNTFWNRVMTPIIDIHGKVIAFGGRVLDDSKPKYVNSPETLVYKKSKTLFALNVAKKSASRRYILCEGYMDVISMHQAGFDTAVCACGTALTPEQVKLLSNYADEVVLAYDSDEAGQKATARSLGLFENSPVKISVLNIPGAKDPDEFIKTRGADAFARLLDGSANGMEYNLSKLKRKYDLATDDGRLEYIRDAVSLLAGNATPTERDIYAGRIAEETNVSKQAILNQLEGVVRRVDYNQRRRRQKELQKETVAAELQVPRTVGGDKALAAVNAEQQLLAAVLKENSFAAALQGRVQPEDFLLPEDQHICTAIFQCLQQGIAPGISALGNLLPVEEMTVVARLLARNSDIALTEKDVELFLQRMKQHRTTTEEVPKTTEEMRQQLENLKKAKYNS